MSSAVFNPTSNLSARHEVGGHTRNPRNQHTHTNTNSLDGTPDVVLNNIKKHRKVKTQINRDEIRSVILRTHMEL